MPPETKSSRDDEGVSQPFSVPKPPDDAGPSSRVDDDASATAASAIRTAQAASATPWFYHMAYRRYWNHWHQVQVWLRAADYARKKAERVKNKTLRRSQDEFVAWPPFAFSSPFAPDFFDAKAAARENRRQMRSERRKKQKRTKKKERRKSRREAEDEEEEEEEEEDPDAIEAACDDQNEFLKLMMQNLAFREKRDAYKRQEEENARKEEISSSQTPREQAGVKRTREMSLLYGGESILVQTLETNLQMKYDEFADLHQPALWPSLPLNLSYGR